MDGVKAAYRPFEADCSTFYLRMGRDDGKVSKFDDQALFDPV